VLIVFLAFTLSLLFCILLAFLLHGLAHRDGTLSTLEEKLHRYARRIAARYKVQLA
jgi:heme exporter protein D